jgi:hypothetical protein
MSNSTPAAYHGWVHNAPPAVNAQSDYPVILGVCISLTLFMMSVVCLRFYIRGVMIRSIGWDDWVVLATAVSHFSFVYVCFILFYVAVLFWFERNNGSLMPGVAFSFAALFIMRCA